MSQDPVRLTSSVAKSDKESLVENNLFTTPLIRLIFFVDVSTYLLTSVFERRFSEQCVFFKRLNHLRVNK